MFCFCCLCRERRRLKKIRKDKNKLENSVDKKHKHKHKCNDEFCKHRKHKKRRKHKKHYHRDAESPVEVKNEAKNDEVPPQDDSVSQTDESNERNDEVFQPKIKEETMTEEEATSSVTESSASDYVSWNEMPFSQFNFLLRTLFFLPISLATDQEKRATKFGGESQQNRCIFAGKTVVGVVGQRNQTVGSQRPRQEAILSDHSAWQGND